MKKMLLMFNALVIAISAMAQTTRTASSEPVKMRTETKGAVKTESVETKKDAPAAATQPAVAARATVRTAGSSEVKPVDSTISPTDPVNPSKKGPNGEVVYIGANSSTYYLDKTGNRVYIK